MVKLTAAERNQRQEKAVSAALGSCISFERQLYGRIIRSAEDIFCAIDRDGPNILLVRLVARLPCPKPRPATGSGDIDMTELEKGIRRLGLGLTQAQLDWLLKTLDADGNGSVDIDEFCDRLPNF